MRTMFEDTLDLGPAAAAKIEALADAFARTGRIPEAVWPESRSVDVRFDGSGTRSLAEFTGNGFHPRGAPGFEITRELTAAYDAVDAAQTVDDYLAAVARACAVAHDCGRAAAS